MTRSDASPTVFLVSPASDNGVTGRRWPELAHRAGGLGLSGETLLSTGPGHIAKLAEQAARDGAGLVVAVGGDGTINETVDGLMRSGAGTELATIPLGTGMDFGRTYGIPYSFEDAVRIAVNGKTRTIDVGRVSYQQWSGAEAVRHFVNV